MSYDHPQELNDLHKALQYNGAGQPELRVSAGGANLSSTVGVSNFPAVQTVDGDINVLNFPAVQPIDDNGGSITIDGTIDVNNFPAIQTVDGNVVVSGTVSVDNFPAVQPIDDNGGSITVDGAIDVNNFPAVQPIDDNGGSITVDGDINVLNFPAVQPIDDNGGSITIDGAIDVNNFPAVQTVDGNVGITGNVTIDNFPAVQPIDDNGGSITIDGTISVDNFPAVQTVDGNVAVTGNITVDNFPAVQAVSGSITVDNFPAIQAVTGTVAVSGTVGVSNFPAVQSIDDNGGSLTIDGTVSVDNFPTVQTVDGTISVDNFPTVQSIDDNGGSITVDGDVSVLNFPTVYPITDNNGSITVDGTVSIDNFPAVQPIDDNGGSITVDGTVSIDNLPAVQPIDDNGGSITVDGTVSIDNFPAVQPINDNGGSITVDGGVNVLNHPSIYPISDNDDSITVDGEVSIAPSIYKVEGNLFTNTDAFGRLRTSSPFTLFDSSLRHHDRENDWDTYTTGTGVRNYLIDESSLVLATNGAGSVLRETRKVFPYQPGKSLLYLGTFSFGPSQAGSQKRVGYYGEQNGIYFQKTNANSLEIVKRSYVSGTIVNTEIPQSMWNVDKLDGTGPSGVTLDHEKTQILFIDIEWLGVGSVRVGFVINGQFVCCHIFHHANFEESVYMTTATLPARYELISASLTDSMKQICTSIISEGGYTDIALTRSIGTPLLGKPLSDVVYRPLVSLRLKANRLDSIVVPTKFDIFGLQQAAYKYQLLLNPTLTNATWANLHPNSDAEYDITATDLVGGYVVDEGIFVGSNKGGSIAISRSHVDFTRQLGRSILGVSDVFCVAAIATTNNDDAVASITWQEH